MSTMIVEMYDALIEAGASEEKAKAAAQVMPAAKDLATKADLQETKAELKAEIQELRLETKAELKVLKFAVFSLYPFVLAIAYRIFS